MARMQNRGAAQSLNVTESSHGKPSALCHEFTMFPHVLMGTSTIFHHSSYVQGRDATHRQFPLLLFYITQGFFVVVVVLFL